MQSTIDGFVLPTKPLDAQSRLRGYRALPDAFFVELAVALESSEPFAGALKAASIQLTPAEIRDMLRSARHICRSPMRWSDSRVGSVIRSLPDVRR